MERFEYLGLMLVLAAIIFIYKFSKKKEMRKAELRHKISLIMDPNGCNWADRLYKECSHISNHYGIALIEVNFHGGLKELEAEVRLSKERASERGLKSFLLHSSEFVNG